MIKLNFLEAADGTRLTKSFNKDKKGNLVKTPYPMVKYFTSHEEYIDNIEDFYCVIQKHATLGHCLLKGQLDKPLINESRAGHTNPDSPTQWMVIDNDHLDELGPDKLLNLLGMGDASYITQYSSSTGIVPGKRGYHIFVLLDKEYRPADLKHLIEHWNLTIPYIRERITLTNSQVALRWPLDITICQSDKLIYISPPICGPGVEDTFNRSRFNNISHSATYAKLEDI